MGYLASHWADVGLLVGGYGAACPAWSDTFSTSSANRATMSAMAGELVPLLIQARHLMVLSQRQLGEMLGTSRRTAQRWEARRSHPSAPMLAQLARRVHSLDADLASKIAAHAGATLESLGLRIPAPPRPPSTPAALAPEHLVDSVVCAAAEAIDVLPRAIRPALLAAFTRARQMGLSVETMEKALDGRTTSPKGPHASKAPSTIPPP